MRNGLRSRCGSALADQPERASSPCAVLALRVILKRSEWSAKSIPTMGRSTSAGIFSITGNLPKSPGLLMAVGGDYANPNATGSAAYFKGSVLLATRPNPTPRLPLRRSLRLHHQNLDHRRPQRHRHLHRRRQKLARAPPRSSTARASRRRPQLERTLPSLRRRPARPDRQTRQSRTEALMFSSSTLLRCHRTWVPPPCGVFAAWVGKHGPFAARSSCSAAPQSIRHLPGVIPPAALSQGQSRRPAARE